MQWGRIWDKKFLWQKSWFSSHKFESGNLNINSLRNKIVSLRDAVAKVPVDILCIGEIKLNDSFPDLQPLIEN